MKLESILSRSHFTVDEVKLSIELEKIIFTINLTIHPGHKREGATFQQIKSALYHIGVELPDDRIMEVLKKLEGIKFDNQSIPIISEMYGKWYSNM